MPAIAITATVAPVNATRATMLADSGPPGNVPPTRITTASVARAAIVDICRLGPRMNGVARTTRSVNAVSATINGCARSGMKCRLVRLPACASD